MSDYQLNWTSFKNNLCNGVSQLQQKEEFVDMTLAADGHLVRVHRNILSVASPYIKEMLQSTTCRDPVVFLNDISSHVLSYILEYIYTGEVKVPKHALNTFIKAAKSLHITGIKDLVAPKVPQELNQPFSEIFSKRCGTMGEPTASVETYGNDKPYMTNDGNTSKLQEVNPQNHSDYNNTEHNNLNDANMNQMDVDFAQAQPSQEYPQTYNQPIQEKSLLDKAMENIVTVDSNECDQNDQYKANITLNFEDDSGVKIQNDEECGAKVPKFHLQIQSCQRNTEDEYPAISISVTKNAQNLEGVPGSIAKVNTGGEPHAHDASAPLYSISNRRSLQLILNRFIYNVHHSSHGNTKHRWRCADYRKLNCKAYIDTSFDGVIKRKNEHTHGFHDAKILKKGSKRNIYSTIQEAQTAAKDENNVIDA